MRKERGHNSRGERIHVADVPCTPFGRLGRCAAGGDAAAARAAAGGDDAAAHAAAGGDDAAAARGELASPLRTINNTASPLATAHTRKRTRPRGAPRKGHRWDKDLGDWVPCAEAAAEHAASDANSWKCRWRLRVRHRRRRCCHSR